MSSSTDGTAEEDLPKADESPAPMAPGGNISPRQSPPVQMVEQFLAAVSHSGSVRDPFVDKLSPSHISKTLDIASKKADQDFELRKADQANQAKSYERTLIFIFCAILCVVFVIWLFLHYDKTDQVFQLITYLVVGGGGVGIGTGLMNRWKKGEFLDRDDSNSDRSDS